MFNMETSSWKIITLPESISLQDIMSEERVKKNKSDIKLGATTQKAENFDTSQEFLAQVSDEDVNDVASDAIVAELLQQHFDEECRILNCAVDTSKRTLQIPINCYGAHQNLDFGSESEEEENIENFRDHKIWNQSNIVKEELEKHDTVVYAGFNVKSSKIKDSLKRWYWKEDETNIKFNLDRYSQLQIYRMITSHQMLEKVNYAISKGKETVILHATGNPAHPDVMVPNRCVLKVFEPKNGFIQRGRIHFWADKEMRNLLKLKEAGIPCPEVIAIKRHILIMSLIGENFRCAPKLKDANFRVGECVLAYNQIVEAMKNLYSKARLIHTDLSKYNILWYNKHCYFLDVSHAIERSHEDAFCFLMRDCEKIINFFIGKNMENIMTKEELFAEITGFDYNNKTDLKNC